MRHCVVTIVFLLLISSVFINCGESSEDIKNKLNIVLKSDLEYLAGEIKPDFRRDSVFYGIESYKEFKGKYSAKAVVEFYIMKNDKAVVLRKYRYHEYYKKWERYFNKYKLNPGLPEDEGNKDSTDSDSADTD